MEIKNNIEPFLNYLKGTDCTLVAVSKTKPESLILEAYEAGLRVFGENKAQELAGKYEALPKDIEWHMIGHLQRNKVKYIAPFVSLIHSVDSLRLLQEIDKQGKKHDRQVPCLLQAYIADETTKFGFSESALLALLESEEFKALTHIKIRGLMGMATNTKDQDQIRMEFRQLKALLNKCQLITELPTLEMQILSMGMSGDYKIAVEEGSTMIRVGSAIFGARN